MGRKCLGKASKNQVKQNSIIKCSLYLLMLFYIGKVDELLESSTNFKKKIELAPTSYIFSIVLSNFLTKKYRCK